MNTPEETLAEAEAWAETQRLDRIRRELELLGERMAGYESPRRRPRAKEAQAEAGRGDL